MSQKIFDFWKQEISWVDIFKRNSYQMENDKQNFKYKWKKMIHLIIYKGIHEKNKL